MTLAGRRWEQLRRTYNEEQRSVTFEDGENICRVLALRVSPLKTATHPLAAFMNLHLEDTTIGQELIDGWREGNFDYHAQLSLVR